MIDTKAFYDTLIANGLDFFAGVPDSLLKNLCACIKENTPDNRNIIAANVSGGMVDFGHGYRVEGMYLRDDAREAGEVKVAVRPEEFIIADKTQTGIPATVKSSVFLGVNMHYFLEDAAGNEIEVMTPSDLSEIIPDETEVRLQVVKEKINIFDAETQSSLIREGV